MYRKNYEKLEEDYFDWLDENCSCDLVEEGCACLSFEAWLAARAEDLAECLELECI